MVRPIKKPKAVLDFPPSPALAILHCRGVLVCYAAARGTLLAAVTPTPEALTTAVDTLAATEATMKTASSKSHTEARDVAYSTCHTLFKQYTASVQTLADASPEQASQIIAAAGLRERSAKTRAPHQLGVTLGKHTTEIDVTAPAGKGVVFHLWELSLDGGKTWTPQTPSRKSQVTLTGIAPGTTAMVRHRSTVKGVLSDWSQVLTILVR